MKIKVLDTFNILSAPAEITNSVMPNTVQTVNTTVKTENQVKADDFIKKFQQNIYQSKNKTLEKISKNILDNKMSTSKVIKNINENDKENLFNLAKEQIKNSNFSEDEKNNFLTKLEKNKNDFLERAAKEIKNVVVQHKENLKVTQKNQNIS
ncbi:hypothetical protein [Mycoplasma buteonis]|uniref:hypothetical protein n=1 Tax=Mycoplasma buteonis TaxID=171280 RepID=UPI00055CBA21|nr:hypothetical protein [Mycoplasma buteonis]